MHMCGSKVVKYSKQHFQVFRLFCKGQLRETRRSLHQEEGPSCVTKAISLTNIELRAIGLEPDLELQTIAKDVTIELNASTITVQENQLQTNAEPTKSPNESESLKTGEPKRTSDTKYDKTEITPLLQIGLHTGQIEAEPKDGDE